MILKVYRLANVLDHGADLEYVHAMKAMSYNPANIIIIKSLINFYADASQPMVQYIITHLCKCYCCIYIKVIVLTPSDSLLEVYIVEILESRVLCCVLGIKMKNQRIQPFKLMLFLRIVLLLLEF